MFIFFISKLKYQSRFHFFHLEMKKSISIRFFTSRNEKINLDLIIFNSKWKIQSRFGFLHLEMKKSISVEIFSIRNQKIMFDMNFFFSKCKNQSRMKFFHLEKEKIIIEKYIFFEIFFEYRKIFEKKYFFSIFLKVFGIISTSRSPNVGISKYYPNLKHNCSS